MPMKNINEIEINIERITDIINNAKILMNDSYKMLITDSSIKFSLVNRNKFLSLSRDSFWKLGIIELAKLYGSRNDHFRLEFFLKDLIGNYNDANWRDKMELSELNSLLSNCLIQEVRNKTEKLKELRDQHYAHTDKIPSNHLTKVQFYFTDFIFLLELAEKIVEILSTKLLNKTQIFKQYGGENVDAFLNDYIENLNKLAIGFKNDKSNIPNKN